MHRLSKLAVLALLLGTAACASMPPAPPPPPLAKYTVERDVVVRRTPSAGADEVGHLTAGMTVSARVEELGGSWVRVESDSGNVGYVFGKPLRRVE